MSVSGNLSLWEAEVLPSWFSDNLNLIRLEPHCWRSGAFYFASNTIDFTISKSKLALLKEISENPEPTQKPIHSNVEDGLAVISGAPIGYKNCTALKEYYPKWSKKRTSCICI